MLTVILNRDLIKQNKEQYTTDLESKPYLDLLSPSLYYSNYEHTTNMVKGSTHNHLINAFIASYNNHMALKLRPTDIMMALQMIVATCINNNSEKFRHLFVEHMGKVKLSVAKGSFDPDYFCKQFKILMEQNIKNPEFITKYTTEFTTTTQLLSTVSNMFLMNCLKEYFSFEMILGCGIPSVIMEGTQEDWIELKKVYEYFKDFLKDTELKDFFPHFDIIMKMFVDMRLLQESGEVEATNDMKKLWERVISFVPQGSGGDTILGGWARLLTPYSDKNKLIGFDKKIKCLDISINVPCKMENCSYQEQDILREYYFANGWNSMQKSCLTTPCDLLVPSNIAKQYLMQGLEEQSSSNVPEGDEMTLYRVEFYSGFFNPTIIDNVVSTNVGFIMREDMAILKEKKKEEYIKMGVKMEGKYQHLNIPITLRSELGEISDCFDKHGGSFYVVDKEKKIEYYLANGVIKNTVDIISKLGIKIRTQKALRIPEHFSEKHLDEIYMCFGISSYDQSFSTIYKIEQPVGEVKENEQKE